MIAAKRFAREWLWYIACAIACTMWFWWDARRSSGAPAVSWDELVMGLVFGFSAGLALYLAMAVIRITLWAIGQNSE